MNAFDLKYWNVLAFRVRTNFPITHPEISTYRYDEWMGGHSDNRP